MPDRGATNAPGDPASPPSAASMGPIGAPSPMADDRIRRQIAFLAAQLMYQRLETEYFTAKRKAARQLGVEYRFRPGDLPSNRDIRVEALRLMRRLARFRPRLIGSVWTGHVRHGSDIDIHIFCDSLALVTDTLDELALPYEV